MNNGKNWGYERKNKHQELNGDGLKSKGNISYLTVISYTVLLDMTCIWAFTFDHENSNFAFNSVFEDATGS